MDYIIKNNGSYELQEIYKYESKFTAGRGIHGKRYLIFASGTIHFLRHYTWHGANVLVDTATVIRASMVHDALYDTIRREQLDDEYRLIADREFLKICKKDGVGFFRRYYAYFGLRVFGGWQFP